MVVGLKTPLSITPEVRNFSTRGRMLPSATRSATFCRMIWWDRLAKNPLDVGVQDKAVAGTVEFEHRLQSHRAIAVLAKAKRRRMEHGFKERIPKAANPLWSDPIADCGNAEGAKLRFICGDEYTSNDVGLHRLDETPLSPNDSAAHRNSWRG